jgi:hypothetical protein
LRALANFYKPIIEQAVVVSGVPQDASGDEGQGLTGTMLLHPVADSTASDSGAISPAHIEWRESSCLDHLVIEEGSRLVCIRGLEQPDGQMHPAPPAQKTAVALVRFLAGQSELHTDIREQSRSRSKLLLCNDPSASGYSFKMGLRAHLPARRFFPAGNNSLILYGRFGKACIYIGEASVSLMDKD